jgi:hypothetical protein
MSYTQPQPVLSALVANWWTFLLRGIAAILLGLVVIYPWPLRIDRVFVFDTKIIRLGDARCLFGGHHDRCGKGDEVAKRKRTGGVLLWGWKAWYHRNGMF